ncbi:hypothetical protein ACOMHN_063035 [Nucella lapillus]
MDGDKASRFVSSLVKSIQALCNGYIDFSTSIEVVGHIHLNIDRSVKLDYVLTEEVSKSISEGATVFASHSYHSHPPPSLSCNKSASDGSSRNRQKQSSSVSHGDEEDSSSFRSLGSDLHNTSIKSDNHSHKRSSESFADSGDSVKQENTQKSCVAQKPSERLRRNMPFPSHPHRSPPPVAKRSRQSDYNNPDLNPQEYEVIEIKEEPDDEPAVFFGNSSADGQDLQTPNFSSVVMESLDRVGKMEGTDLMGGEGGAMQHQQQQPPFPVMMHSNSGMPSSSSSGQGPSLSDPQDQSFASTSGSYYSQDTEMTGLTPASSSQRPPAAFTAAPHGNQLEGSHHLQTIPRTGKTPWPQKPCIVCKHKGLLRKSRFFCVGCARQPGFCKKGPCFMDFHSVINSANNWNSQLYSSDMDFPGLNKVKDNRRIIGDDPVQGMAKTLGEVDRVPPAAGGGEDSSEKGVSSAGVVTAAEAEAATATPAPQGQSQSQASKQKHYLQRIPKQMGKELPPSLQGCSQATLLLQPCKVCREEGFGKVTPFFCPVCPGQPAFCCSSDCFISYHKRMGYSLLSVPVTDVPKKPTPSQPQHTFQLRSFKYL